MAARARRGGGRVQLVWGRDETCPVSTGRDETCPVSTGEKGGAGGGAPARSRAPPPRYATRAPHAAPINVLHSSTIFSYLFKRAPPARPSPRRPSHRARLRRRRRMFGLASGWSGLGLRVGAQRPGPPRVWQRQRPGPPREGARLQLREAELEEVLQLRRVRVLRAAPLSAARAWRAIRGAARPPPPPRTKWTRRVPHPVLIGHAASHNPPGAIAKSDGSINTPTPPAFGGIGGVWDGKGGAEDEPPSPHTARRLPRPPEPLRSQLASQAERSLPAGVARARGGVQPRGAGPLAR